MAPFRGRHKGPKRYPSRPRIRHFSEPDAYRADVPNAAVHVLDGGHFVLDTRADEAAALIRAFIP